MSMYRYVGFYGRRTNPAITIAGQLFFGQVIEVNDSELEKKLNESDDFERTANTCHWIESDGTRCPHVKDESEVYCQIHLCKLRLDSVVDSPNSPTEQANDNDSGKIAEQDSIPTERPKVSGRKRKWSA